MKKKALVLACFLLSTQPAFALLSPLNQSIAEIQSIIQNADLQKYFPQDQTVVGIQRANNGYLLKTDKLQMYVEIQYIPAERPGKQQYKLVFHDPSPLVRNGGYNWRY